MIFVWVWLHHVVKGFDPFRTALGQTSLVLQRGARLGQRLWETSATVQRLFGWITK